MRIDGLTAGGRVSRETKRNLKERPTKTGRELSLEAVGPGNMFSCICQSGTNIWAKYYLSLQKGGLQVCKMGGRVNCEGAGPPKRLF